MTSAFGGSSADGLWSLRDAYDVLELAQVLHLKNATLPADANARLAQLIAMTAALPTQSVRSETQIAFQQFSTPAPIGFLDRKSVVSGKSWSVRVDPGGRRIIKKKKKKKPTERGT